MENRNRIVYFDFLRVIAVIAVVVLHTAANRWSSVDVHSYEWRVFNVYDGIARWCVPVFVMISGALFLSPEKEITVKTLYKKNVLRLAAAFLGWSLFYALASFLYDGDLSDACLQVFTGRYHLWYLYMLAGLYIIVPLLRKITADRDCTRYFLLISFVFTFVIPTVLLVLRLIDLFCGTSVLYQTAYEIYENMHFHFAAGYSFYFVLGHYLHENSIGRKLEITVYVLGVFGFLSTVCLTEWLSLRLNAQTSVFYDSLTLNVMLESTAVFVFAKNRISGLFRSETAKRIVGRLSRYSFGVYLVHVFILAVLRYIGLNTLTFNPAVSVPCIAAAAFVISLGISAVLNRIPVINRYFV